MTFIVVAIAVNFQSPLCGQLVNSDATFQKTSRTGSISESVVSIQSFDQFVGEAGGVGGQVFMSVLAHPQDLASARLMFIALDFTHQGCPWSFFLIRLQFAHHQALHLDPAYAFATLRSNFEGDGTAHPGTDAAGEFGVPCVTSRSFAAVGVAATARHGQRWRQVGKRAFSIGDMASLGMLKCASVGEGLRRFAGHLAADWCVFASAHLGLDRQHGVQAKTDQGATQNSAKVGVVFHLLAILAESRCFAVTICKNWRPAAMVMTRWCSDGWVPSRRPWVDGRTHSTCKLSGLCRGLNRFGDQINCQIFQGLGVEGFEFQQFNRATLEHAAIGV